MNRRLFLLGGLFQARITRRITNLQIEVMEVFLSSDGPCALLVHHATEATRDEFSRWVRANSGSRVAFRLPNGTQLEGRVFRVSLCFGRGLILTRTPVTTKAKDRLTVV